MPNLNIKDLDTAFLQRAQKITSFNLSPADFITLNHKSEIQYLFHTHFFPKFDLTKTLKGAPDTNKLNQLIRALKSENAANFSAMHNYNLKGVGPGETTLFFLCDKGHLGGGASAGLDIVINNKGYEIKAGNLSRDNYFSGFKLGGTVPLDKIVSAATELRDRDKNIKAKGNERNGVNGTQIKMIEEKYKDEWVKNCVKPYIKLAHQYLTKNPLILMINTTPAARKGEVFFIGTIRQDQVEIDVISQGTVKPKIKF